MLRQLIPAQFKPSVFFRKRTVNRTSSRVFSGPFEGLHYVGDSVGSVFATKLIGTYERELHSTIELIIAKQPSQIIDIGAAEGYYAVGLAARLPKTQVTAFEACPTGRELISNLAELNEVADRIDIKGKCEPTDLEQSFLGNESTVVICDVEGYEKVLLDPNRDPGLATASILVEVHDGEDLNSGNELFRDELQRRFDATHTAQWIEPEARHSREYPFHSWYTRMLPESLAVKSVAETRTISTGWLWFEPRQS